MNRGKNQVEKIDIKEVKAAAIARMKENENYKHTALMLGLMLALINVPVLIMNYASTGFMDINQLTDASLGAINTRLMMFQLLIMLFVTPAFTLSKTRFMLKTMRDKAGSPNELFDGLGRGSYFVSVRATIWMAMLMYVWIMIPASLFINAYVQYLYGGGIGAIGFMAFTAVLALFVLINRTLAYSMQFFMLAEQPRMGAIMSLRLSVIATHGRLMEMFKLNLRLLLYLIPPTLPNLAAMLFFKDSMLFAVGMSVLVIVLTALCYPVVEAAQAEYFLRIHALAQKAAQRAQKAQDAAWDYETDESDQPKATEGQNDGNTSDPDNGEIKH